MAVDSDTVELNFADVIASVAIPCDMKVFDADTIEVFYNNARTLATVDTDYAVVVADDFESFTVTPTPALLVKINAAIVADPTEDNVLFVHRELPFTSDFQQTDAFLRDKIVTEFDKTIMLMQQLKYEFDLISVLPLSVAAAQAAAADAAASAASATTTVNAGIVSMNAILTLAQQGKLIILTRAPTDADGVDGNMYVWNDSSHLPVYIKSGGHWGASIGHFIGFDGHDGAGSGDVVSDDNPTVVGKVLVWSTTGKHVTSITLQSIYDAVGNLRDGSASVVGQIPVYSSTAQAVSGQDFAALLAGAAFGPMSNVALAGTSDISATNTVLASIGTGTGPITSFGATKDKYLRLVKADVAFTVTRNATNLETPNGQDINVGVGDVLVVIRDSSRASAKTQVLQVIKPDGRAYRGPNDIPENLSYSGIISPTQITSNQNDYTPTGAQTAASWRINSDAARTVTGMVAPTSGRAEKRIIRNVGSFPITLSNESASSSAANRFTLGADVVLAAGKGIILLYDVTTTRWGVVSLVLPFGALAIADRVTLVDQNFAMSGIISPAQITSNQNDYSPANLAVSTIARLSTDASRNITGLLAPTVNNTLYILNIGSNNIVLTNANASSTAANRFDFGGDRTLAAGDGLMLWYDLTAARWKAMSPLPSAGGGGSGTTHWGACDGRLSYATGVYDIEAAAAVSAATSIFWTVTRGGQIGLYDGVSAWSLITSTEKSIKLTDAQTGTTNNVTGVITGLTDTSQFVVGMKASGTGVGASAVISTIDSATQVTLSVNGTSNGANTITFKVPADTGYDVYGKNVTGALKLFLKLRSSILTKNTTVIQDGVEVLSGDTTKRWLGAFITSATDGQFDWARIGQRRFRLYNHYNRMRINNREMFVASGTWYKPMGLVAVIADVFGAGGGGLDSLAGSSPGTAGGTSSFGSWASATGGGGGTVNAPGQDGTGSSGDVNISGGGGKGGAPNLAGMPNPAGLGGLGGRAVRNVAAASLGSTETVTCGAVGARSGTVATNGGIGQVFVDEIVEV